MATQLFHKYLGSSITVSWEGLSLVVDEWTFHALCSAGCWVDLNLLLKMYKCLSVEKRDSRKHSKLKGFGFLQFQTSTLLQMVTPQVYSCILSQDWNLGQYTSKTLPKTIHIFSSPSL